MSYLYWCLADADLWTDFRETFVAIMVLWLVVRR